MNPVLWPLAGAVADELNAAELSIPFDAVRRLKPSAALEELASLRLTVCPIGNEREILVRGRDKVEPVVDVGYQQAITPGDEDAEEALIAFGEELSAWLLRRSVTAGGVALACIRARVTIFDPKRMHADGVFTGVVTCTFSGIVSRGG